MLWAFKDTVGWFIWVYLICYYFHSPFSSYDAPWHLTAFARSQLPCPSEPSPAPQSPRRTRQDAVVPLSQARCHSCDMAANSATLLGVSTCACFRLVSSLAQGSTL